MCVCVCNLVFGIPLHAARRAMATAPPLPKQSAVAVLYITVSMAPDRPGEPRYGGRKGSLGMTAGRRMALQKVAGLWPYLQAAMTRSGRK